MFHVMLDYKDTSESQVIISVCDNEGREGQFGPILNPPDKTILARIMNDPSSVKIADADSIVWYALDLQRHVPAIKLRHFRMEGLRNPCEYKVYSYYQNTEQNRQRSRKLARIHLERVAIATSGREIGFHDPRESTLLGFTCPRRVVEEYREALPFFRMKWLEIQELVIDVYDHHLRVVAPASIPNRGDAKVMETKFQLTLSAWPTHMVMGSELEVDIKGMADPEYPDNVRVKGRVVMFTVATPNLCVDDITGLRVLRHNEVLSSVISTLRSGTALLTGVADDINPFVRRMFCLPPRVEAIPSELNVASLYKAEKPKDMPIAEWRTLRDVMQQKLDEDNATLNAELEGKVFSMTNEKQRLCAESKSSHLICLGYPGTGKTQTLAAYVLKRFNALTTLQCGWIICLTNSNVAARAIVMKLLAYAPMHGYLKHAYSSLFQAFHPEDFVASHPFRVTPNEELQAHGIMVCTIGKLRVILRKHPLLALRCFDLVTDESGQIWKLSSVDFLSRLPNLRRWGMFGDPAQLPPYVTRLIDLADTQPSVMDVFLTSEGDSSGTGLTTHVTSKGGTKHVVRLNIQYRMIPVICEAHAPLFYDYKITSARTVVNNPGFDGRFYRHVSMGRSYDANTMNSHPRGVSQSAFVTASCNLAFDTLMQIKSRNLLDENENHYSFAIITPYVHVMEELLLMAKRRAISRNEVKIRTYDRVQGDEAHVVIIVTGRSTCSDLNKDRSRGNVALSRARDIVVLIATERFFMCRHKVHDRLRYWGQWLLRPFLQTFGEDRVSMNTIGEVRALANTISEQANIPVGYASRNVRSARSFQRASSTSDVASADRETIGKMVILKKSYWNNGWRNMVLFKAFCECDEFVARQIVDLFATTRSPKEKYIRCFELLALDPRDETVDEATDKLVRAQYSQHVKPSSLAAKRARKRNDRQRRRRY